MYLRLLSRCLIAIILTSLFNLAPREAHAGQVVTDGLRQWARDAIAREKSLDTRAAPNTIAILYFDNQSRRRELDPLKKGLTLMLITDLAKIDSIQVVERARLQALVDELNLGKSGLVDPATAPRVGHLLGAAYLFGGRLLPANKDDIHIVSDLLRVGRQDTLGHPASSGPFDALLRMEKEILFDIVRLLDLQLSKAQIQELQKPLTTNLKALILWFQGINLSDQQHYQQAAVAYEKAIQADKAFKQPAAAIDELRRLKLITALPATKTVLERLHKQVSVNSGPVPNQIVRRDRSGAVSVQGPATQTTGVNVRWR
jgi:TolB-like protein